MNVCVPDCSYLAFVCDLHRLNASTAIKGAACGQHTRNELKKYSCSMSAAL